MSREFAEFSPPKTIRPPNQPKKRLPNVRMTTSVDGAMTATTDSVLISAAGSNVEKEKSATPDFAFLSYLADWE